ncbi:hypothetical protein [Streptomyces sp. 900105245]
MGGGDSAEAGGPPRHVLSCCGVNADDELGHHPHGEEVTQFGGLFCRGHGPRDVVLVDQPHPCELESSTVVTRGDRPMEQRLRSPDVLRKQASAAQEAQCLRVTEICGHQGEPLRLLSTCHEFRVMCQEQ